MQLPFYMFSTLIFLEDRLKVKTIMYGYNAGPPMAIPVYTVRLMLDHPWQSLYTQYGTVYIGIAMGGPAL